MIQETCTIVFGVSCALLVYVVAGYPALAWWMSRHRSNPIRKDDALRSVSIVIAARNGARFLADKLDSILALDYPLAMVEIIVVSDGSDDRTDEIALGYADKGVALWRIPRSGKSAALNLGISKAANEILVLTDVRQRLHPDSLRCLVGCFGDPTVGAASGKLLILKGETEEEADTRLYWQYEMLIRRSMSRIDSTFGCNGPFYAMRRSLTVPIPPDALLDDVYLPMAAFFQGYRLILEECAKAYDYPTSLNSEFGRKVRTQAGLYQMLRLYPQLLSGKNRMRFHFLSGKFGRLTLPYLMLAIGLSSAGLPAPWNTVALIAQAVFYGAALLDLGLGPQFPLKRLTSAIRTFVTLVISSLMGLRIFFVQPRKLWKETQVRKVSSEGRLS